MSIETVNQLNPHAMDYGLDLYRIDAEAIFARFTIQTDQAKHNRVVFNLLSNAVKLCREPRSFRIWISKETEESLVQGLGNRHR